MGLLNKLFGIMQASKIKIPKIHNEPIDKFYKDISIEEISLYQLHFDKIIKTIDVINYTNWSQSQKYNRNKLAKEDRSIFDMIIKAQEDGIKGVLLSNMINQFFFADIYAREFDKSNWVRRVIHRKPTDYFPDALLMRKTLELFGST